MSTMLAVLILAMSILHSRWPFSAACHTLHHTQAVQLLDSRQAAPVAAGLLYQLSIEDSAKPLFAFCSGALPRLYESIMRAMGAGASGQSSGFGTQDSSFAGFAGVLAAAGGSGGDLRSVPELIALAVNLAHSKRTAEVRAGQRVMRLYLCGFLCTALCVCGCGCEPGT
jgi:hypothetical protein